jgi:hypothetical protein
MFVDRLVGYYSALFNILVGWHASAVSFSPGDIIFAQLACPLNDVIFLFTSGLTNLSLYKHCSGHNNKINILPCYQRPLCCSIWQEIRQSKQSS